MPLRRATRALAVNEVAFLAWQYSGGLRGPLLCPACQQDVQHLPLHAGLAYV
jgi:hypothetical protein